MIMSKDDIDDCEVHTVFNLLLKKGRPAGQDTLRAAAHSALVS